MDAFYREPMMLKCRSFIASLDKIAALTSRHPPLRFQQPSSAAFRSPVSSLLTFAQAQMQRHKPKPCESYVSMPA